MLSGYFKRLLMARQLHFLEGDVEIFDIDFALMPINHYLYLRDGLEKKHDKDGLMLLYDAGKKTAIEAADHFSKKFNAQKRESITLWHNIIELTGFGKIQLISAKEKSIKVQLISSFAKMFVENNKAKRLSRIDEFLAGYLAGVFSTIYGKEFDCQEVSCIASGNKFCEFVLKGR